MGLFDLFSNNTAETAANQRNQGLQAGYEKLSGLYGSGRDALSSGYGNASNAYSSLMGSANAGAGAYGDASGANGAGGLQRATDNFKNSGQYGAYGFSLDQGLQGLNRTHAAAGNLNSGNADTDAMKFASGLAGQQYNNYLQGLSPYLGQQNSATAGYANAQAGLGGGLNNSFMAQGNAANANDTAQGASSAAATMNNYNVGANQLGALFGVGKLAAGGLGGFDGFNLGATSLGGPGGPKPVSGGLFSMFGG